MNFYSRVLQTLCAWLNKILVGLYWHNNLKVIEVNELSTELIAEACIEGQCPGGIKKKL